MALIAAGPMSTPAAGQQPAAPELVASADVSDEELELFTRCLEDVLSIRETLEQDLATVQDGSTAQEMQEGASVAMVSAIEGHGMDVDRYNQIAGSLLEDQQLNQRVAEMRQELQAEGAQD